MSPESNCGSCVAGVVIDRVNGIQRCDECKVFDDDQHAALALFDVWVHADPEARKKYWKGGGHR